MSPFDRRGFLRAGAAGLAAIPLTRLDEIASPWTHTPGARKSRVALVRTSDRKDGVARAVKLLDPRGIDGKRVMLKPNFNTADAAPGSTHNDTLAQIVRELQARGARSVTLGESSGPPRTSGVMQRKGIPDLARDVGFEIVDYETIPDGDWVAFKPAGTHWPEGFWLPRQVVQADYNVSTCCLKTHGYGGVFTMSLKLSVGLTPKRIRRTMHGSPDMRRMIAELNGGYRPSLVLLDGVDAFTDGGPSNGTLAHANVILAGDDRVAIDAVGLAILKELGANDAIMSRPIFQQEQIARAVELKLGATGPGAIELVTWDTDSAEFAGRIRKILDQA